VSALALVARSRYDTVDRASPRNRIGSESRDLVVTAAERAQVIEERLVCRVCVSVSDRTAPQAQLVRAGHPSPFLAIWGERGLFAPALLVARPALTGFVPPFI
jgi:hypothetical protein